MRNFECAYKDRRGILDQVSPVRIRQSNKQINLLHTFHFQHLQRWLLFAPKKLQNDNLLNKFTFASTLTRSAYKLSHKRFSEERSDKTNVNSLLLSRILFVSRNKTKIRASTSSLQPTGVNLQSANS